MNFNSSEKRQTKIGALSSSCAHAQWITHLLAGRSGGSDGTGGSTLTNRSRISGVTARAHESHRAGRSGRSRGTARTHGAHLSLEGKEGGKKFDLNFKVFSLGKEE